MEKTFIKLKSSSRYGLNSPSSWFGSPSLGSGMILSALDFSLSSHFFWEVNQIRNFDKTIQLTELWEYLAQ